MIRMKGGRRRDWIPLELDQEAPRWKINSVSLIRRTIFQSNAKTAGLICPLPTEDDDDDDNRGRTGR